MAVLPNKANPPLIVDADRMLTAPLSFQGFEPVTGRHAQVVELSRIVQQNATCGARRPECRLEAAGFAGPPKCPPSPDP